MSATATATIPSRSTRTDRVTELKNSVKRFQQVHTQFVGDVNRSVPDVSYWEAAEALIDIFGHGDLPGECRVLAAAVGNLRKEVTAFDARENQDNYYPKDSFWLAVNALWPALENVKTIRQLSPLETVKTLDKQGVSHAQICKMYGFVDSEGRPELHKVQQELDLPGAWTAPGKWTDPRLADLEQQIAEQEAELDEAVSHLAADADDADDVDSDSLPCPETPEELFLQNVSIEQSSKMLKMPIDEVAAMFDSFRRDQVNNEAKRKEAEFAANQDAIKRQAIEQSKANVQKPKLTAAEAAKLAAGQLK